MILYGLECRCKVVVGGHDHADIVVARDSQPHEVDGQRDADTFFLRLSLRVPEFPLYDRSSVPRPALALCPMSGEGTPSPVPVRRPEYTRTSEGL